MHQWVQHGTTIQYEVNIEFASSSIGKMRWTLRFGVMRSSMILRLPSMSAEPTADNQQLLGLFSQFALLGCKGGKITAEIMYRYIDTYVLMIRISTHPPFFAHTYMDTHVSQWLWLVFFPNSRMLWGLSQSRFRGGFGAAPGRVPRVGNPGGSGSAPGGSGSGVLAVSGRFRPCCWASAFRFLYSVCFLKFCWRVLSLALECKAGALLFATGSFTRE